MISLGGIVKDQSIRIAGDVFTQDIIDHMRSTHNVKVGERMAEQIKINVGSVLQDLENPPEEYAIWGADLMDTLPKQIKVTHQEIAHCLEKSVQKIEAAILKTLEETPPALYADIVKNGVYLTGGGALLRGISERLTSRFAISFKVAEDPLLAVAKGTGIAVNNIDTFKFLIK